MQVHFISDPGKVMQHNEDACGWTSFHLMGSTGRIDVDVLFVADGIGGLQKGEVASKMVAKSLTMYMASFIPEIKGEGL